LDERFSISFSLHISLEALTRPKQGFSSRKGCVRPRSYNCTDSAHGIPTFTANGRQGCGKLLLEESDDPRKRLAGRGSGKAGLGPQACRAGANGTDHVVPPASMPPYTIGIACTPFCEASQASRSRVWRRVQFSVVSRLSRSRSLGKREEGRSCRMRGMILTGKKRAYTDVEGTAEAHKRLLPNARPSFT